MSSLRGLPSVDRLLRDPRLETILHQYGRSMVTDVIRRVIAEAREDIAGHGDAIDEASLVDRVTRTAAAQATPSLRRVFNLTGTVLHTNLGRAPLPREAIDAVIAAAGEPSNIEFDLEAGKRGDRDEHVEAALCRLTGAAAATVVNNNAAAVLLVLNTLALRKEVPTSRGELIEIGGSFRMPDIMKRAGCTLREVGTTNRVHLRDYADAIGPKTGLVMKVHTSNYEVVGFTASVPEQDLSSLCRERSVPFVVDLGSGMLVDLSQYGLPHEPTPSDALAHGADLVTFSGDKLLGGPHRRTRRPGGGDQTQPTPPGAARGQDDNRRPLRGARSVHRQRATGRETACARAAHEIGRGHSLDRRAPASADRRSVRSRCDRAGG